MEFLKKSAFFIFVVFILFLFIWALYLPKHDITKTLIKTIEEQKKLTDILLQEATFSENVGGVKYWEIKAKSSSLNKSTGVAAMEQTNGIFFKNNKPALKFISPLVTWNTINKNILLSDTLGFSVGSEQKARLLEKGGNQASTFILPQSQEGYYFKAKVLSWDINSQKIICSQGIYFQKGNVEGNAEKLQADVGLETVSILGNPCKIVIAGAPQGTIEAKDFLIDQTKNEISSIGKIILTADNLKLTAGKFLFKQKEAVAYFGNSVNITYDNASARGDQAAYNTKKQEISLMKNVSLLRKGSRLVGDKVIISLKNKTYKIIGKTKIVIPEEEIK
ncbi:MAG: hypothetical protein FD145_1536 [Candidatus Saganbacteria bacterium]|uniref:Organic solvent tolerance-like N-terminal domain-containing protein n=1 Tax=Candidatus Saganbacteria bacterium TaxID=2575572 RepID=A0A833L2L8_UNCSA|nr:MAG: hypothetical protein FD145_1536 [Candidatus Saganbacteria bacterium]